MSLVKNQRAPWYDVPTNLIIIGVGATGSWLVAQADKCNMAVIAIDYDIVDENSYQNQNFKTNVVGMIKTCSDSYLIEPEKDYTGVNCKITREYELQRLESKYTKSGVIVNAVDNVESRKIIRDYFRQESNFFDFLYIEPRVSMEFGVIWTAQKPEDYIAIEADAPIEDIGESCGATASLHTSMFTGCVITSLINNHRLNIHLGVAFRPVPRRFNINHQQLIYDIQTEDKAEA
jgi:hypothetical protein